MKHEPGHSFWVHAEHSTTRVLGTRFFVNRRKESDEIKVISGRVEVSDKPIERFCRFRRGRGRHRFRDIIGASEKIGFETLHVMGSGFLVYENETLEAVIEAINRYRPGMVFSEEASLRQLKINGRLSIKEPHDMLKVLQRTMGIKMTYVTDWLVIIG